MGDISQFCNRKESLSSLMQRASSLVAKSCQTLQSSVTYAAAKLNFLLTKHHKKFVPLFPESQPERSNSSQIKLRSDISKQLEPWRKNPAWVDDPATIKVTVPKGSLCKLDCIFKVGIPPDAVFSIIIDPDNKRVFKNIQRVNYRKVLHEEGNRQLVEVEQEAMWRFLWLSGTMTVRVLVDQNYDTHTLSFSLAKDGFMKRFEGSWNLEPLYIESKNHPPSSSEELGGHLGRVASLVKLQQIVQPALIPPPPFSWYIRGITTKTIETMIQDLQAEGKSIRENKSKQKHDPNEEKQESKPSSTAILHHSGMKSESRRKAYWFNKKRSRWDISNPMQ